MHKIHYDRERKSLVDEVNAAFSGTRVSEVVSATRHEFLFQKVAEERTLEWVLEKGREYTADAYEIVDLKSGPQVIGGMLYYEATAGVIFYQSTTTIKGGE